MRVFSLVHSTVYMRVMHTSRNGDFSQAEKITHSGAMLVGTYDNFTDGDPSEFLRNLNDHMPTARENQLIFIEKTGHTYQGKNREVADDILQIVCEWRKEKQPKVQIGIWESDRASILYVTACKGCQGFYVAAGKGVGKEGWNRDILQASCKDL